MAGLPNPPTDRIWLLRSPWLHIPVAVSYEIIWSVAERRPSREEIQQVYRVARDILAWDEERALAACPAGTRVLLDAWAQAGRIREVAATVIEHRLRPTDLADASTRTGVDEDTLLEWLESLQTDPDEAIAFINAWRSAGLPGNPPPGASGSSTATSPNCGPGSMPDSISTPPANSTRPGSTPRSVWRAAGSASTGGGRAEAPRRPSGQMPRGARCPSAGIGPPWIVSAFRGSPRKPLASSPGM